MESIWEQVLKDKKEDKNEPVHTNDFYTNLSLAEIKKRDIAFQVYSKYVDDTFWICSNDSMVEKIKQDDPISVIYHIDEIVRINNLKPDVKSLKSIHEAKKCFRNSKIINANQKGT